MNSVNYGRAFISDSLGFHIIFASLGIGLPLMISVFELLGILKKSDDYEKIAKKVAQGFLIIFGLGTVSGTIISFQLSLLWPKFMEIAGQVISLPFVLEGFMFFIESIFVILYFFGWNRIKNKFHHWLLSIPIVICSTLSGVSIVIANAWMNSPQGFDYINHTVSNIDPIKAMLNPAMPSETSHVIFSSFLFSSLALAGVFVYLLMKGKYVNLMKKGIYVLMISSLIFAVITIGLGDLSAKYVAHNEPIKLAAMEGQFNTQNYAPEQIGGIVDEKDQKVNGAIKIPGALSFLANDDFSSTIKGLNDFDKSLWPPLFVHYTFDIMVGSGTAIFIIIIIYFVKRKFKIIKFDKTLNILIILSGFLALICIETGWMTTEIGRQPFAIRNILKTQDAFTTSHSVAVFAVVFPIAYLFLLIIGIVALIKFYKRYPLKDGA